MNMSYIEGIGDEVVLAGIVTIIIFLATIVIYVCSDFNIFDMTALLENHTLEELQEMSEQFEGIPTEVFDESLRRGRGSMVVVEEGEYLDFPGDPGNTDSSSDAGIVTTSADSLSEPEVIAEPETEVVEELQSERQDESNSNGTIAGEIVENGSSQDEVKSEEPQQEADGDEDDLLQPAASNIKIRLKSLDDTERIVTTERTTKILDFKRVHFPDDIANHRTVRLIFNGQLLRDTSTIGECDIQDKSVVHVQISSTPLPPMQRDVDTAIDLSNYAWPLAFIILGICWISFFKYPQYFNMPSTTLLIVLSLSCLAMSTHRYG